MNEQRNFDRIAQAIEWLNQHRDEQPELDDLADAIGLSPHHLQRIFQEWAGLTPKQYLKALTRKAAVERLHAGETVLAAALNSGLSGPGRLHDLTVTMDALTPGEIKSRGRGAALDWGVGETLFGRALVSWNQRGINFLGFCHDAGEQAVINEWKAQWQNAELTETPDLAQHKLDTIFTLDAGTATTLWLRGSPFQLKVWEALMSIPTASHVSYGDIASYIRSPGASRAVGSAIGNNPVAWIIPCHRVIRKSGAIGGYRWGQTIKSAMVAYESCKSISAEEPSSSF